MIREKAFMVFVWLLEEMSSVFRQRPTRRGSDMYTIRLEATSTLPARYLSLQMPSSSGVLVFFVCGGRRLAKDNVALDPDLCSSRQRTSGSRSNVIRPSTSSTKNSSFIPHLAAVHTEKPVGTHCDVFCELIQRAY